jgi:hypothetical protein
MKNINGSELREMVAKNTEAVIIDVRTEDEIKFLLILCLTFGLAPFTSPHIWEKILWIAGGAKGMQAMDWFDTVLHGIPWVLLIRAIAINIKKKNVV